MIYVLDSHRTGAVSPLQADHPPLQAGEALTQLTLCLPGLPHPLAQVLL